MWSAFAVLAISSWGTILDVNRAVSVLIVSIYLVDKTNSQRILQLLVYTLFALFEYIVVLTNMGFHLTSVYDFRDKWLVLDAENGFYFTSSYSTLI